MTLRSFFARVAGALRWPSDTRTEERGDQRWIFPGRPDSSGNPAETSAVPAIWAAVTLLSQQLARLPHVAGRWRDGYWEPRPEHYVSRLLADPDPEAFDPQQWRRYLYRRLTGSGNGYAIIHLHETTMRPFRLELAECSRAEWTGVRNQRRRTYRLHQLSSYRGRLVTQESGSTWPSSSVIALHGPGFDGLASPSPIEAAGVAHVEVQGRAVQHQLERLRGVQVRNAIEADQWVQALNDDDRKRLYNDLREQWTGAQAAGQVPILPPGFKLATPAPSPADLQIVELLKWGVHDIARIFGVPPTELFAQMEGMPRTTIEAQNAWLERRSLAGHIETIEAQLTCQLFSAEARTRGWAVRLPVEELLAGSLSEMAKTVELIVTRGGLATINEGRRLLKLPPRPDGDRLLPPKGSPPPMTLEMEE